MRKMNESDHQDDCDCSRVHQSDQNNRRHRHISSSCEYTQSYHIGIDQQNMLMMMMMMTIYSLLHTYIQTH